MDTTSVWQAVLPWPKEQKLELALRLCDQSIEECWVPEPSDELTEDLDRRLAAHEADPTNVRSWGQIRERIQGMP